MRRSPASFPESHRSKNSGRLDICQMNDLFRYIWRNSRGGQLRILAIVILSFPFYYLSLDIPKYIVSDVLQGRAFADGRATAPLLRLDVTLPSWLGGIHLGAFEGFALDRINYLFALSGLFLLLVLLNSGFKYVINMRKGALGERLLQQLRFDLFSSLLQLTPEAARHVKPSEAATIIKDEVEPIGGFVGDAFVQPAFLGGQVLTALGFILLQNLSLGLIAAVIVLAQAIIIPRLRHEQVRLGRERQLASRALAGKIGEVVDALGEIGNHGTHAVERALVAGRLEGLFHIRYRLYGRKFAVKSLNNLLAQAAPFLFYAIGGYYALTDRLDIGQLVAVIVAYRDLPPPIKDLIDWDQQRLDAEAKFQQIGEQFALMDERPAAGSSGPTIDMGDVGPQGQIVFTAVSVAGATGEPLLERASLSLPLGRSIALVDVGGESAAVLAQILGGRITDYTGTVSLAGKPLTGFEPMVRRRALAYVGPEAVILDGSLRDNILYGLRRSAEPVASAETLDLLCAGCEDTAGLDRRLISVLQAVGLDDLVFRYGLEHRLDAEAIEAIAPRISDLRASIRSRLQTLGLAGAIEPYDPARYIQNASIGENLIFGWAIDSTLNGTALGADPLLRQALDAAGLTDALTDIGLRISKTMLEIFDGLPADHILFEQFAFFPAQAFPIYRELLARVALVEPEEADRSRLLGLAMLYIEPRHRLGLLDKAMESALLAARHVIRDTIGAATTRTIAFYDPATFCKTAPLRDNFLFGAIAHDISLAGEQIVDVIREVLTEHDLARHIYALGLDQPAGYAGRLLFASAKTSLMLARSLIRRPQILILNDALSAFSDVEATNILKRIQQEMAGRTLIVAGRKLAKDTDFDLQISFEGTKIVTVKETALDLEAELEPAPTPSDVATAENDDVRALRSVALFAGIDMPRLRLLAFTSARVRFSAGEALFRQGEDSDAAYVILIGSATVTIETANGPVPISSVGENAIVGEMGLVTGEPRSATILAQTEVTALRLQKQVFLALLAEFPQMALSVTRLMVRRLQENVAAVSHGVTPDQAA